MVKSPTATSYFGSIMTPTSTISTAIDDECIQLKPSNDQRFTKLGEFNKSIAKYNEIEKRFKNSFEDNQRLKYELQTLLRKTTEVETSLAQLKDLKMKRLKQKVSCTVCELSKYAQVQEMTKCNLEANHNSLISRVCSMDGRVHWSMVSWDEVLKQPHVIIYLIFRWLAFVIFSRIDARLIEDKWKKIDKNKTATNLFAEMYDKGEKLFKGGKGNRRDN